MEHIVKSEIAIASWQKTADVSALVAAVVLLAVLGVVAAINASSPVSIVIAALVGLSAILFIPAAYAISRNEKH